jgi:HlyD family secretion protein
MSKGKKILIFGGIAVLLIILVVVYFKSNTTNATEVHAEKVQRRHLVETVSASGRIQPQTKVNITSEVTGEIIALPVKEGDTVKAGTVLVVLDTVQLKSDLDQARFSVSEISARLEGAKTALDQSQEEYNRQKRLFESKLTSETAYNDSHYSFLNAKSSYDAMLAQSKQAQARLEKQIDYLSKARIAAPMSGIVTLVDCEVGEIAPAQNAFTQGKTLMTISNLDIFEVEVEVDETEIGKILQAQPVKISVDAFPDTSFAGEVVEIGNTAILTGVGTQDQSTNFKVKVIFKDTNVKIRPGMSATVDITTKKGERVLSVPYAAVVVRSFDADSLERSKKGQTVPSADTKGQVQAAESTGDSMNQQSGDKERKELKGVFLIKQGKAHFMETATGIADQKNIEILSGINDGDSVITGPYRSLRTIKEGEAVTVIKEMKDTEKK